MTRIDGPDDAARAAPDISVRRVLGIPVRFEVDDERLVAAVRAAYGPDVAAPAEAPVCVRLVLEAGEPARAPEPTDSGRAASGGNGRDRTADDGGAPSAQGRVAIRTTGRDRLVLRSADAAGRADARRGEAVCRIAPALPGDPHRFREILDTLTLWPVTRLDRQPVHGAGVVLGDRGLVLAGPSGVGKSTLTYAALQAGFRVLDDDAVYVQLEPGLRVWGRGRALHLAPDAATFFPELADRRVTIRANGKRRIAVERVAAAPATEHGREPAEAPCVARAGLCLLERGADAVACRAIPPDEAVAAVLAGIEGGFAVFRATIEARLRALAAHGAWRLRLSDDPRAAVPHLRDLIGRVR